MSDPCRELRGALGAAALGDVDPVDDIALRAHLDGCAACRAELAELTQVARALATVPLSSIDAAPTEPPGALAERVLDRLARERLLARSGRRRRVLTAAGAVSALAAAVIAVVLIVGSAGDGSPGLRVAMPAVGTGHATAIATLRDKAGGTEVAMKVVGLDRDHYYWLWLTDENGHRFGAGTFRGSNGPIEMRLTAALRLAEARRIWVTDADDAIVLDARVPLST